MAAPEDVRYRQSSQFRLWSFSPAQLASMRDKTNRLACASISDRLSPAPVSAATTPEGTPNPAPLPEFLAPHEELQLLNVYTIDLLRAGSYCNLPTEMKATAAVFLRRFYVTNSIMTYPPTDLLLTCLFFGCKAEGYYQSVDAFAAKFDTTPEKILAGEFMLCQGLRFALDVRHPFRALEGAVMELRSYGEIEDKRIVAAHGRAREILKFSPLVTDAYFHYTPSQLMLAALSLADRGLADRLVHETFSTTSKESNNGRRAGAEEKAKAVAGELRDRLLATVDSCREMLAKEPPERMTEYWGTPECNKLIKPLRQKLKKCRDPDRWDLVALQRARREQAARKGSPEPGTGPEDDGAVFGDPDRAPDSKKRKAGGLEDPFGGPL